MAELKDAVAADQRKVSPIRTNIVEGAKHTGITDDTEDDEDEGEMDGPGEATAMQGVPPTAQASQSQAADEGAGPTTSTEDPPGGGPEGAIITDNPAG